MPRIKFPYKRFNTPLTPAFPDRKSISKPLLPVKLICKDKSCDVWALVDSGAYATLVSPNLCSILGINLKEGKESIAIGIGGAAQKTYFHDLELEVGGYTFNCYAGFTEGFEIETVLLGQEGFFNFFKKVIFDYNAGEIELVW